MTEDEARQVELVRAIETEDREAALLTREDRAQAEAQARTAGPSSAGRHSAEDYIAKRGAFASARLATRHPGVAGLLKRSRWPRWLGIALPLAALAGGLIANEFGTAKRLDLLAVPLLGTIAWNLVVYAWLILALAKRDATPGFDPLYRVIARVAGLSQRDLDRGTPLHRAALAFESRWASVSAPLTGARISRTLHLAAALFASGLIAGIYLRALVIEYRAGWESTFLGADAVHALLTLVLGPASWLTAVGMPGIDGIAAMRWTGAETGGVNAGPWIVLYTATVVGLVVVPRLLLAVWHGFKAYRLARRFPMPGREDFYFRRLLRGNSGAPGTARVTPYAYRPGEETQRRLSVALRAALGDGAQVRFDEPIAYGSEDLWIAGHPADPGDDYHILLFTLAATPELENHGALADALVRRAAAQQSGTVLAAVIDESPYRAHFAGQTGLDERIAKRLEAWRTALAGAGIVPLSLDLSREIDTALAQRIESGLLPDGAMHG